MHVYGYGKLADLEIIPFSNDLQAIFGNNEAGKSTLMSFIHSVLFGFPTKQQNIQRYEPKASMKYGGKLILETVLFGQITIERLKSASKASGEVTVYFPDGTTGGEEILQQLFNSIDKAAYQRIYSFDIHGIQKVQLIKSDDFGKFLFSSGMIGTDAISQVDDMLDKALDRYFKPNGKKPIINEKLLQIKELHKQLLKKQESNLTYNRLLEEKRLLEAEFILKDEEKEELINHLNMAETKKMLRPLLIEKNIILHKLEQLPVYEPFPIDGIKRYEKLQAAIQPYEAQRYAIEKKKALLNEQLQAIVYNEKWIEQQPAIEKLQSEKSLFVAKVEDYKNLENELNVIDKEIHYYKEQLNQDETNDHYLSFNTSITRKQFFQKLSKDYLQLEQQQQLLDAEFHKVKTDLEASEHKIKELENNCLKESEREKLIHAIQEESYDKWDEKELEILNTSLIHNENRIAKAKKIEKQHKQKMILFSLVGWLICLGVLLYGLVGGQYGIAGIALMFAIFIYFFYKLSPHRTMKELEGEREDILAKQSTLKEKMNHRRTGHHESIEAQKKLAKDDQIKSMLETERIILKQKEQVYEKMILSYEAWEKNWFEINGKIDSVKKEYHFPHDIMGSQLTDLFQSIEQIKDHIQRKLSIQSKVMELKEDISRYHDRIDEIAKIFEIHHTEPAEAFILMKKQMNEETDKKMAAIKLQSKCKEIDEELNRINHECDHLNRECIKLFEQAKVETEAEFLAKGKANEESQKLMQELALIDGQLSFYDNIDIQSISENEEQLSNFIHGLKEQIAHIKEEEKKMQAQLADIKYSLKQLEEGGEYSSLLQAYTTEKSQLQELVRKWAVFALAKDMLNNTVNLYKNERLPAIIAEVEKNLKVLTNGEYQRLFAPHEQQTFIVERFDGVRFSPAELSQATAEQLYTALRFALATKMPSQESYPIMIDDSFVNFDKQRTENTFKLLHEISKKHQVIFFSCHHHLQKYLRAEQILRLS